MYTLLFFKMSAQNIHSPYLLPSTLASCRLLISSWGWCSSPGQLPFSVEILRYSLLQDLICSQRASEQTQMRVLQFRKMYQMQWAIFTKSHNGLIWKGPKSHLIPASLSWSGTLFTRPGCSKPPPALPEMGHLWEVWAPSLFCLRMPQPKVFPAKETLKIIGKKYEKMANVSLLPQLFLLSTDKIHGSMGAAFSLSSCRILWLPALHGWRLTTNG